MKIYAIFKYPENGYNCDVKAAKDAGLVVGEKYELHNACVGGFHTDVYLEDVDGSFNSVQFEFVDELGNDVNIYKMPEFSTYACW